MNNPKLSTVDTCLPAPDPLGNPSPFTRQAKMRLSRYFLTVLTENPDEDQIVSHRNMLRAGMIKKQAAGSYSWIPLDYRVLKRIEEIVHQEQIRAGHIPLLMPTIQPADLWRESGRYGDYGEEMLRITDRQKRELLPRLRTR